MGQLHFIFARLRDAFALNAMCCALVFTVLLPSVSNAQAGAPVSSSEFPFAFAGLRHGDTIDKALKLFGEPEKFHNNPSEDSRAYWVDGNLSVTGDWKTRKVEWIHVRGKGAVATLRLAGVKHRSLEFIGQHRDKVVSVLGTPRSTSVDRSEWEFRSGNLRAQVEVICYDFDKFICSEVIIFWPR